MSLKFDLQLGQAGKFTNTLDPGASSTNGGTSMGILYLGCGRPLLACEIVNTVDTMHALTLTWQYRLHSDSDWRTIPATRFIMGGSTATANTTTEYRIITEGYEAVQLLAYYATGGVGSVIFRGNCSGLTETLGAELALGKATTARTSTIYNGGGTSNALQLLTTQATIVTGNGAVVSNGANNVLEAEVIGAVASQSCTLCLSEYSAATPTIATLIRQVEVAIPTSDMTATVDLSMLPPLTTATGYAKQAVRFTLTPGAYSMLTLSARSDTSARYARYQLFGGV